jgi:hypothetical protein
VFKSRSSLNLQGFKSAMGGQSGSIINTLDNASMLVTYKSVNVSHNSWVVLLMQPSLPR